MGGDAHVIHSYSIVAPDGPPLRRLAYIHGGLSRAFDEIVRLVGSEIVLCVEEGMFRGRPKVCAMLGEVRGIVMAEAWRRGWKIRKIYPVSWKTILSTAERKMKKDAAYRAYWNKKLELKCRTADEVDATLIARYGLSGKVSA
jgi:Holliday junction resolvasome RuvABC endonuclease subunit